MMPRFCLTLLAAFFLWLPAKAGADDFKPAYLQLTQTGPETYEVMWKLPALDESTALKLTPYFREPMGKPYATKYTNNNSFVLSSANHKRSPRRLFTVLHWRKSIGPAISVNNCLW